jgi:hypothetical protein
MSTGAERREARRYTMALPLRILSRSPNQPEVKAETRDVSYRGLYFYASTGMKVGSEIEFVLMLPKQITLSSDVHIRCRGQVLRVEENGAQRGIAARIDRYEFLHMA